MNNTPPLPRLVAFAGAVAIVSACAAGQDRPECAAPTEAITNVAATAYTDSVEPIARRFLIPQADFGDSVLPGPAQEGLRAKGPAYFYPADPAKAQPVHDKLIGAGPYPALLVFYHGMEPEGDSAVTVSFSGRYVTGMYDGTSAPRKSIRMVCGADGAWQIARPAAPDTTGKAT